VVGHAAVRDYWNRQFTAISSKVEPLRFMKESDGSITVDVHRVVHDAHTGELLSDSSIHHRYRLKDGLIVRMDVLEQNAVIGDCDKAFALGVATSTVARFHGKPIVIPLIVS
jgi:hypothetical protein